MSKPKEIKEYVLDEDGKKLEKLTPYTEAWEHIADSVARSYCPPIISCKHCGGARASGYCCGRCGYE